MQIEGSPLGFVPVVISGLTNPSIQNGVGLWIRSGNAANYSLVRQGSSAVGGNDFWQANYIKATKTYELIYNIEIVASPTTIAFGTFPDSWQPYEDPDKEKTENLNNGRTVLYKFSILHFLIVVLFLTIGLL